MAADIKAMTAELARDPDSLVFLQLGEALRVLGNLDAAVKVAMAGCERHPDHADAHDLLARVFVDAGNFDAAHEEWERALQLEDRHVGAHKGMGFLLYRLGELDHALDHLETALATDPTDQSVVQALRTVRAAAEPSEADITAARASGEIRPDVFAGFDGAEEGILLVDGQGRVLGGGVRNASGEDVAAEVAAYLAGAAQEAERTARLLELGVWRAIAVEAPDGHLHVSQPRQGTFLLIKRDRAVPPGRVALLAQRAAAAARTWLQAEER